MSAPAADEDVRIGIDGACGVIRLDRPRALNALTAAMIASIHAALKRFAADPAVAAVLVMGAHEKVFCAGGDVRAVREDRLAGRDGAADDYFRDEFALNLAIARFPKPYVALIDGVCMGGGLGLAVHGARRVVTDRLVMAMPETAIGYVPDVGASHFLNSLPPGQVGLYLALTGARLDAADALYCGLATACVPHHAMGALTAALTADPAHMDAIIAAHAADPAAGALRDRRETIDRCFGAGGVAQIFQRLDAEGGGFAAETLARLRTLSPASLAATFDLLKRTRGLSLEACLQEELALAKQMTRGADFIEGVRAVLVDKDHAPRWAAS